MSINHQLITIIIERLYNSYLLNDLSLLHNIHFLKRSKFIFQYIGPIYIYIYIYIYI